MLTNKEIELATEIQKMQRDLSKLESYIKRDAEDIVMYLDREEPNIDGAIRKAKSILKEFGE